MSTKWKLLRKSKYSLNDLATKQVFISQIHPAIKYNCLTNPNFTKTQEEKLNMLDRQAESILGNDLTLT